MQPHGYLYAARGGATIAWHPRPAEEGRRRRHRASDVDRNARADRATHRRPRRDTVVTHCCGRRLRAYDIRTICDTAAISRHARWAACRPPPGCAGAAAGTGRMCHCHYIYGPRIYRPSRTSRRLGLLAPDSIYSRTEPQTATNIKYILLRNYTHIAQRAIPANTGAAGSGGHPPAYASGACRLLPCTAELDWNYADE